MNATGDGFHWENGILRHDRPVERRRFTADARLRTRQAVNNDARRKLADFLHLPIAESPGPFPPKGARLAPAESIPWPADSYSIEGGVYGVSPGVGTWKVGEGKVILQGNDWPNFRAPLEDATSPFGDKDLVPWPDSVHEVCLVTGQGQDGADDEEDIYGRTVRYPRHKAWFRLTEDADEFLDLRMGYLFECETELGYFPRKGKGKRSKAEPDFLAAWLHKFRAQGIPSRLLEKITHRSQQGVSELLARHAKTLPVEEEPWKSRRAARKKSSYVDFGTFRFLTPRPRPFHPNYSTDVAPYWAATYEPTRSKFKDSEATPTASDTRGVPPQVTGERTAGSRPLPASAPDSLGEDMTPAQAAQLVEYAAKTYRLLDERLPAQTPAVEQQPAAQVIDLADHRKTG